MKRLWVLLALLTSIVVLVSGCDQGTWTTKAGIRTPRVNAASGVVDGILYVAGGASPECYGPKSFLGLGGSCASVEAYNPLANTWTIKAPMPTSRSGAVGAVANGIFYVIGSEECFPDPERGTCRKVEAYNPATDTWTTVAPLPTGRGYAAIGVIDGILYVAGGMSFTMGFILSDRTHAYDPTTNTWTDKASMPAERYDAVAGVLNGVLYVAGGNGYCEPWDPKRLYCPTAKVEAYDPVTNTWATKSSLSTPRAYATAGVMDGLLYIAGGFCPAGPCGTEARSPAGPSYSKSPMLTPRSRAAGGVVNRTLYVVGGMDDRRNVVYANEAFKEYSPLEMPLGF